METGLVKETPRRQKRFGDYLYEYSPALVWGALAALSAGIIINSFAEYWNNFDSSSHAGPSI